MNKSKNKRPILCLDWDGVIYSYTSGWQGATVLPDPPVPGALDFIAWAMIDFKVAIYSSRSHQWGGRRAMKRWLRHNVALELDRIVKETDNWNMDEAILKHPILYFLHTEIRNTMEPWNVVLEDTARRFVKEIDFPNYKPPAKVSIDDRVITFTGEWPDLQTLKEFRPWNK